MLAVLRNPGPSMLIPGGRGKAGDHAGGAAEPGALHADPWGEG